MSELGIILVFILFIIFIILGITPEYDKCYSDIERQGYAAMNCCGGLSGGTKATDYLSEQCIDCPYLVLGCNPKNGKENKE